MKNLKKLNRTELRIISGNGLVGELIHPLTDSHPAFGALVPVAALVDNTLCNVQCLINGMVQIKLLKCGSTC